MRLLLGLFFVLACSSSKAQSDSLLRYWQLEVGGFYFWDNTDWMGLHEGNLDFYPSFTLWPRLHLGPRFRLLAVRDNIPSSDWQAYYLAGATLRWDLVWLDPQNRSSLFVELSGYRGNFCACDDQPIPYRREGLWYLGLGGGFRWYPWRKNPQWGILAAFNFHGISHNDYRLDTYNFPYLAITWRRKS